MGNGAGVPLGVSGFDAGSGLELAEMLLESVFARRDNPKEDRWEELLVAIHLSVGIVRREFGDPFVDAFHRDISVPDPRCWKIPTAGGLHRDEKRCANVEKPTERVAALRSPFAGLAGELLDEEHAFEDAFNGLVSRHGEHLLLGLGKIGRA